MKIKTSSNPGFTLVEIMIVVAIIGLLAAIVGTIITWLICRLVLAKEDFAA